VQQQRGMPVPAPGPCLVSTFRPPRRPYYTMPPCEINATIVHLARWDASGKQAGTCSACGHRRVCGGRGCVPMGGQSPVQRGASPRASFGCLAQALSDELVAHAGDAVHHADARNAHLHGSAQHYSRQFSRGTHCGLQGYSPGTHGVLTADCTVLTGYSRGTHRGLHGTAQYSHKGVRVWKRGLAGSRRRRAQCGSAH
jgi:hypothetical protein